MNAENETQIITLRGQKVILDRDLAELYGVPTKRLNEQVRRNSERFPDDFMFQLNNQEFTALRSQIATSKGRGGRRSLPFAFTEHGIIMAANVLNSKIAIDASIMLVRAFIQTRKLYSQYENLNRRLHDLERRIAKGFSEHEGELQEIRFMISRLEEAPATKRQKLGFRKDKER